MGIKEDVDKFIESAGETSLGLLPVDDVDNAISSQISALIEAGFSEEDSDKMIFESLAHLIENNIIPDTPDLNASEQVKEAWIQSFNSHIVTRLSEMGVEFE